MTLSDSDVLTVLSAYLERYPDEAELLSEPLQLLRQGGRFTDRQNFRMHATAGALLVRDSAEILLIDHRAYGILLQPGGHLEDDPTLLDAAKRELLEETGVDPDKVFPASPAPVYVEYSKVPARPAKGEPEHYHLDFGFSFTTTAGTDIGRVQETEVTGACWYPLAVAERLVGRRIARAVTAPPAAAED